MERLTEKQSAGYDLIEMHGKYCEEHCRHQDQITCRNCAIYNAIQKLAHYEDLEEQGLLLKLPCKVGDTIYYIDDYEIYWDKVYNIDIRKENEEYVFCVGYMDYKADDFGETVFLTKEEAEKALEEMEK